MEVPFVPKVVNPLSISTNKGKKRLILDLRYVNNRLWKEKVKFEDWKVFQNYLSRDGYIFNFDLKSGYHHIDIYPQHQTYLGFSWFVDGVRIYFVFTVLPFGLSPSPFVLTKLLRPLVKYWRLHGLLIVVYIDDGICITIGLEEAKRNSKFVRDTLIAAGLVPNVEKSNWEPSQTSEWLGIVTDTHKGVLFLPKRRIESLTTSISNVLSNFRSSSARSLARVTGKIMSMHPVVGSISGLMTRYLYSAIDSGKSWDSPVNLLARPEILQELQFWENNINSLNVKTLFEYTPPPPPSILSFSDASSTGCGTILSLDNDMS